MIYKLPKDIKTKLNNKTLIFTITSGRTGTNYLAKILNLLESVDARHEPYPRFSTYLRKVIDNPDNALDLWSIKLSEIAKSKSPIYVETSNVFCKGFMSTLQSLDVKFKLIVLYRNIREIALSLYCLNSIPGRTTKSLMYMLKPDDPICYFRIKDWEKLHDYQLCYWYALEMYYHCKRYDESWKGTVSTDIGKLKNKDILTKFLNDLDIPIDGQFWNKWEQMKNKKVNAKNNKKRKLDLDNEWINKMEIKTRKLMGILY